MEIDNGTFKKVFPHLTEEMEAKESKEAINSTNLGSLTGERVSTKRFDDYNPDVIDFICRCDNEDQAQEIINYIEKRGEIDQEYAQKLRTQLKKKGVRSFGAKREEGYYLRELGH
jgi:hypothetical protein